MKTHGNDKNLCLEAKEYYYEILCRDGIVVPDAVARHVESCSFCQEQVQRLRDTFVRTDAGTDPSAAGPDNTSIDVLSRQFEFLDEPVTCSHVKPFLPSLLVSSPRVRIPTPITVHVENCPQCARALAAIERLGLSDDQLVRLGRFYAQSLSDQRSYEAQASRHAGCEVESGPRNASLCDEITAADLFDCILPCEPEATGNEADERRREIAAHLRTCPSCMERTRSLRQTIHEIAEREDSGVRTLYRWHSDEEMAANASKAASCRYPVHVEIRQPAPIAADLRQRLRIRLPRRSVLKGAALVAASVLVVSVFLVQSPTATGKNLGDLLRVVRHEPNVHITTTYPHYPTLSQEMWVSRDLNRIVIETDGERRDYDLNRGFLSEAGFGRRESAPLTKDQQARCARYLERPLEDLFCGVQPGDDLSQVDSVPSDQPGATWAVYELVRHRHTTLGEPMWNRWKVFIDPGMERPVKIESSSRRSENDEWDLNTITCLSYPAARDIEEELKATAPSE